jgi:phosphoribosylformylglycinamidine synthase
MKAFVYVGLKKTVLDPQGKTIHAALRRLGHTSIRDIRQGKYFEIELDSGVDREKARTEIEQIARDVLTNPVIEEFRLEIRD